MFVETVTQPREDWDLWVEKLRMYSDPPAAMVLSLAWDSGDGHVTQLNVWDNPSAVGDLYMERVAPVIAEIGEPADKPNRHGTPIAIYVRDAGGQTGE